MKTQLPSIVLVILLFSLTALGHDTWLQSNSHIVRVGDVAHIDLMLGNHGNDHRDFKLAGKPSLEGATLEVIDPDGQHRDLRTDVADVGYTEKDGFLTVAVPAAKAGLYTIAQMADKVVSYAPQRSIKSAKTFFLATRALDRVEAISSGFDQPLGHPLELIPLTSPVAPMGPGTTMKVKLLFRGQPLQNARISFIPRGQTLAETFDERFERMTDAQGVASIALKQATYHLIAAHHQDPREKGEGYESIKYSATLTVLVPAICPCCGE